MNKTVLLAFLLPMFFASLFVSLPLVKVADANFVPVPMEHIYIQPDGSISPTTVPLSRVGADIYIVTGNLSDFILDVKRDNIVVDGAGYTLQRVYEFAKAEEGILLQGRINVTIKNFEIRGYGYGIRINGSSANIITGNKFVDNRFGIWISDQSTNNVISENSISETWTIGYDRPAEYRNVGYALSIHNSSANRLRNNQMHDNDNRNFWVDAQSFSSVAGFENDVDASNTIDGRPIYYWINEHDREVQLDAGYVALINCVNITARNLTLASNGQGVLLAYTTKSAIVGNNLWNNTYGIELREATNNNISDNNIADNNCGISAYNSGNVFRGNDLKINVKDANFESGYIDDFDGSNTIEGTPAYCWVNQQDKVVPSNAGYVALIYCRGITVSNLVVSGKKQGILVISSSNSTIASSSITLNKEGIYIKDSFDISIVGNQVANNSENGVSVQNSSGIIFSENNISASRYGVFIMDSEANMFEGNRITDNMAGIFLNRSSSGIFSLNDMRNNSWCGINLENSNDNSIVRNVFVENGEYSLVLKASTNNAIYQNNFVNNSWRGFSHGFEIYNPWPCEPNVWDNGTVGNYWSNYFTRYLNATEMGNSGIGNTAYFINVNNTDHYPLIAALDTILPPEPQPSNAPSTTPTSSPTSSPTETAFSANPSNTQQPTQTPPPTLLLSELIYASVAVAVALAAVVALVVFLRKKQ